MKRRLIFVFLFIAGLVLLAIGGGILLTPHAFHASNGIVLGNDPNLLSEIRAPGGLLVVSAVIILIGTMRPNWRQFSVVLTVLIFGSFGLARLVGLALDGMPSIGIIAATVIELVVAAIGLLILRHWFSAASKESANPLAMPTGMR